MGLTLAIKAFKEFKIIYYLLGYCISQLVRAIDIFMVRKDLTTFSLFDFTVCDSRAGVQFRIHKINRVTVRFGYF